MDGGALLPRVAHVLVNITGGGDLTLATFNVLNFFNTTGQQYVANGAAQTPPVNTQCSYFNDRDGTPIGNNTCGVVSGTPPVNAGQQPAGGR